MADRAKLHLIIELWDADLCKKIKSATVKKFLETLDYQIIREELNHNSCTSGGDLHISFAFKYKAKEDLFRIAEQVFDKFNCRTIAVVWGDNCERECKFFDVEDESKFYGIDKLKSNP